MNATNAIAIHPPRVPENIKRHHHIESKNQNIHFLDALTNRGNANNGIVMMEN